MKKFFKRTALVLGGLFLLGMFLSQNESEQRWGLFFGCVAWLGYAVITRLDRMRAEVASLRAYTEAQMHDLNASVAYCEELLVNARQAKQLEDRPPC